MAVPIFHLSITYQTQNSSIGTISVRGLSGWTKHQHNTGLSTLFDKTLSNREVVANIASPTLEPKARKKISSGWTSNQTSNQFYLKSAQANGVDLVSKS
ncbi:unnamed protein product [Oikopleura dioica]|uniref:Uncharacterized protein n=1 Tax=Oikopleura dioica TaxID=34765 RepID=E4YWN0_OIKDI|nr:unnamed protein product [Oikopleura dioica]